MKTYIIIGKSGSGKSSVAKLISDYYNRIHKKTIISGYAKYLKLYAHEMINYDFSEENKPRDFLQKMGSYIRIDLNMPNMLSERLLIDCDIYKHFYDVLVVSDSRLSEEVNYLKNHLNNVCVLKVVGKPNYKLTMKQLNHETETSVDLYKDYDYLINNELDMKALKVQVESILEGEK